ncbi:recombinase family protein [uncultured Aureimonas sp.]|uniref:recombinase family protein n=1 Tax=uncultured Aureimonas sp. TaxID=1604662 RepID=UPI0025F9C4A6|nr:recombinase family protein [uncultured Aureimonas sp.]
MVIDWNQAEPDGTLIRAAQYVRMSTEHQRYSTDNQSASIRNYAEARGYEIVRTYADEGKSGLDLKGRTALRRLLDDVENRKSDFTAVLVYDVSRWGRFQDPDEAAEIELRCRRAGVAVHYCAEQFENDGSIGSSIVKTVKRVMAGEYVRELSVKVFAGQANLIRQGFRQGGAAGFGLRRMLVDETGASKGELRSGQQKSIATDRVVLVPGPADEVAVVKELYALFVSNRMSETEIAIEFNRRGIANEGGRAWTRGTIHQILINEKYIGHNVWGRTSFKLKKSRSKVPSSAWIRSDGSFEAIVDPAAFQAAQAIIRARSERLSDATMLQLLAAAFERHGQLSGLIIDETEGCPSSGCYGQRFGSLLRAYALVGFVPDRDYRYLEINKAIRRMHPDVFEQVLRGVATVGGKVDRDPSTDLLTINDEFTVSLALVRCCTTSAGSLRWKVRLDASLSPDLTVVVRMDPPNRKPMDFYLLPRLDMHEAVLHLCEYNGLSLDAYRFDTLDRFFAMTARTSIQEVA